MSFGEASKIHISIIQETTTSLPKKNPVGSCAQLPCFLISFTPGVPWLPTYPWLNVSTTTGSLWKQSKPFRQCDGGYLQRLGSAGWNECFFWDGQTASLMAKVFFFGERKIYGQKKYNLNTTNDEWIIQEWLQNPSQTKQSINAMWLAFKAPKYFTPNRWRDDDRSAGDWQKFNWNMRNPQPTSSQLVKEILLNDLH